MRCGVLLLFLLLADVARAHAADAACAAERDAKAKSACLTRRLAVVEKELTETVLQLQRQTRPAPAGDNVVKALQRAERQFAGWRLEHCQWLAESVGERRSGQAWTQCFIRLTEQHTAELRRQLPAPQPHAGRPAAR